MNASLDTSYYRTILPSLPTELAIQLEQFCQSSSLEQLLDALVRFVCGADCPQTLSGVGRTQWSGKQQAANKALNALFRSPSESKRSRDSDEQHDDYPPSAKRQRVTPPPSSSSSLNGNNNASNEYGRPVFTLHAISVTSPIRKKVDINVLERAIHFTNPNTQSTEAVVPLSGITRAFLLPTRGKSKPHWTIVLLSSDIPDRGKPNSVSAQANPQVIFGVEATASSTFTTTAYNLDSDPTVDTVQKGGATLPSLRVFLSRLGIIRPYEPTVDVFKSACPGYGFGADQSSTPSVEAYRAAKAGNLWFMEEGILWGESKPCEFWAVQDLLGKSDGLRILSAGGRTCSVTLTRKSGDELAEDEEDVGIETEFSLIDAREQDGINKWVREHRHLLGKKSSTDRGKPDRSHAVSRRGPMTIKEIGDQSDEEDEDFEMDSDGEGGSSSSSSGSSQTAGEAEDESEEEDGDAESDEEEEEELEAGNHPLLRPGAVPRMSRAAIDMAIGMVKDDFMGRSEVVESEEEDDEHDELDE
ncbi:hypothetical protein AX17_003029 [Amanita inopinata Kibby_2008]|nr:hypothetical protein AX17_003029 [Amanita inopinata Kibby_2008]